ncbi:hypothetical protein CAPTEDRAFT_221888 [Capitella teleta]|uniref:C2H2-type domain-containing protein n=1 Tax=Capitella teleta TaxID=283909 RepID=R7T894_CAPTE|nr:hypothetical protein CAPTEDRAFT_221888 [Capitella teleta]|eukprot:ELT87194.1 hypothetical protein CAPTEDRAFT_221888 [Capitella teleta]
MASSSTTSTSTSSSSAPLQPPRSPIGKMKIKRSKSGKVEKTMMTSQSEKVKSKTSKSSKKEKRERSLLQQATPSSPVPQLQSSQPQQQQQPQSSASTATARSLDNHPTPALASYALAHVQANSLQQAASKPGLTPAAPTFLTSRAPSAAASKPPQPPQLQTSASASSASPAKSNAAKSGVSANGESKRHDPYEFNAKMEDGIRPPAKKAKVEKNEASSKCDASVETVNQAVITEPDMFGPCEPGSNVVLEGIVWNETLNGLLVVNVTWRGKTYVGTLMDATRHDWAPPRLNCDSPTSDLEARTPKGRGSKRGGRGGAAAVVAAAPKPEAGGCDRKLRSNSSRRANAAASQWNAWSSAAAARTGTESRRRLRNNDSETSENGAKQPAAKRLRADSSCEKETKTEHPSPRPETPVLIECPEPNCSKKYRHINGLKYHQSHAHKNSAGCSSGGEGKIEEAKKEEREKASTGSNKDTKPEVPAKSSQPEAPVVTSPHTETKDISEPKPAVAVSCNEPVIEKRVIAPAVSLNPVSMVTTPSSSMQLYQISGAPIACLHGAVVTQAATGQQVTVTTLAPTALVPPAAPMTAIPVTVATAVRPQEPKRGKETRPEKKLTRAPPALTSVRPIMPAPSLAPQVSMVSTPLLTTGQMNCSPAAVSAAAGTSSQLKPIQPKPTILGISSNVDSALAASLKQMKQDTKKPKKKKKDKEKKKEHKHSKGNGKSQKHKDSPPKLEKQAPVHSVTPQPTPPAPPPAPSASAAAPASLVAPPAADKQTPEDAHSPAYSDISDANESAPTLEKESGGCHEPVAPVTGAPGSQGGSSAAPTPFYSQPPSLTPAVAEEKATSVIQRNDQRSDQKPMHRPAPPTQEVRPVVQMQQQQQKMQQQQQQQKNSPQYPEFRPKQDPTPRKGSNSSHPPQRLAQAGDSRGTLPQARPRPTPDTQLVKPMVKQSEMPPPLISDEERRRREETLKEESRRVLKENIELKPQMESRRPDMDRQDVQRYLFYQQKMLEARYPPLSVKNPEAADSSRPSSAEQQRAGPSPKEVSAANSPVSNQKPQDIHPASYGQIYGHPYLPPGTHYPGFDPVYSPVIGYAGPAAFIHPAQVRFQGPRPAETPAGPDKALIVYPPEAKPLDLAAQPPPASTSSGQYYSNSPQHKIHELKDVGKAAKPVSPAPSAGSKEGERPASRNKDTSAQRHVHTHHHTHVAYPVYSPYGSIISPGGQQSSPANALSPRPPYTSSASNVAK